jgi:hypothetical protein
MSDRENLLNNLKIDRSAAPSEENLPSNRLYLLGVAVLLVSFFGGYFCQMTSLKKLLLLQLNLFKCLIPLPQVFLMPLAM